MSDSPGTPRQQKRGRERRRLILQATRELLSEKGLEEISLSDVAERSGIPPGSLYHFYPSLTKLFSALAAQFYAELREHFRQNESTFRASTWQEYVHNVIQVSAEFYRAHPPYQELMLSGKATEEMKRKARLDDFFRTVYRRVLAPRLGLPLVENDRVIFHNTLMIIETMLSVAVIRDGSLHEAGVKEAQRAGEAYMGLYVNA